MQCLPANWEKMVEALGKFRKQHGHCNVPSNSPKDLRLGRWVAAQRYRRKVGVLPEPCVRQLDAMGFCWRPGEEHWMEMYAKLKAFQKRHRHCDVPENWAKDPSLAGWVHCQRHKHRRKRLASDREELLNKLGFSWAIYKCQDFASTEDAVKVPYAAGAVDAEGGETDGEKLYAVGNGVYVQYCGKGTMPKELREARDKSGDLPPYIPLPCGQVTFHLGDAFTHEKKIRWRGAGALPDEVMVYVRRNGNLPRYD